MTSFSSIALAIAVAVLYTNDNGCCIHAFAPTSLTTFPAISSRVVPSSNVNVQMTHESEDDYYGATTSRRDIIDSFANFAIGAALTSVVGIGGEANALDFDSFEKGLIEKDTTECNPKLDPKCIPKLTADEALCKYGVPGADARSAACLRVRDAGGQLPGGKKAGERKTTGWENNPIAL
mmetsp:Transcript_29234/g.62163  ORF Transcript_29234/g.62163 Transcript_29234/m.62163 type:complete len:179 (-) Transcript_29234:304-840(-)|eukprot:CAMPEP_0172323094 /NCGR_PEP_ID=MMETSP1058-20130122/47837_1 /TAXON_ID=83371 /ORGANISM="Detonula confervacea, Strain CCMP 353" /LENGTH=178 /DNA_ID=CAMNT_0013039011 /DNA_START=98 /DNA_END=634 /DNA_ORIENTATION=-